MKIGIYTTDLGKFVSGGLLCIIETLNHLVKRGHECYCFVDNPPYRSDWLQTNFPVLPVGEVDKFDGILVSPYTPTAKAVSEAKNAQDRYLWCHTNESLFVHNTKEFRQAALESYKLPLKIFCTASYLQILMETVFNRNVIGTLVPPGIDPGVFYDGVGPIQHKDCLTVGFLDRRDWVRGTDTVHQVVRILRDKSQGQKKVRILAVPPNTTDRRLMANYYREMDIYLDLSRVAGSPVPVKEASACGAIPICSKYGTTDMVLDGYNGFIVPQDDPQYVSELIMMLSQDSMYDIRVEMAKNAAEYVKRFTWDNIADRFIAAIVEGQNRNDLLTEKKWSKK